MREVAEVDVGGQHVQLRRQHHRRWPRQRCGLGTVDLTLRDAPCKAGAGHGVVADVVGAADGGGVRHEQHATFGQEGARAGEARSKQRIKREIAVASEDRLLILVAQVGEDRGASAGQEVEALAGARTDQRLCAVTLRIAAVLGL